MTDLLEALTEFQNQARTPYACEFWITPDMDPVPILHAFQINARFHDQFHMLGPADGMGSMYMAWRQASASLMDCPIAAFGSEGGVHVVASNFGEFLQLLSIDADPIISHETAMFYKSEDEDYSPRHAGFREWLIGHNIAPVTDAEHIISLVKSRYQSELNALIEEA